MKLFAHRTIGPGLDSIIIVNGQKSVTLSLEQFLEAEPDYALPLGFVQREYSPKLRHDLISREGELKSGQVPWTTGDKFLEKIASYQTLLEQQESDVVEESSTLEALKERRIQELSYTCHKLIEDGFTSRALGDVHHYDGSLEAQTNLLGVVTLAAQTQGIVPLTCTEIETGRKQPKPHTLNQIQQVFADGTAFKTSKIGKYHELKAQVLAVTSKEAVAKITWDSSP